jgi:Domain of unknown function (DUF4328)/Protein of unknown function (DUF2510)
MADTFDTSSRPDPGWYPDPGVTGQLRWWDGGSWTSATGAAPGFGSGYTAPSALVGLGGPQKMLDDERRAARTASVALILGAAGYIVMFVTVAVLYHTLFGNLFDRIRDASRSTTPTTGGRIGSGTVQPAPFPPGLLLASGLLQIVQFGLLAVGVIFLAWFYKASQLAQAAGLPLRRTPGLATGGFIIPIVSWWWPYQSTRDLFVPGDPRRRIVGRWWALWLCTQFMTVPLFIASLGPPVVAGILVVIGSVVAVFAALAARGVVAAVGDAHTELSAGATGASPMVR